MHTILKWEIFFSQNVPPYDKSSNPYDLVFVQPSISQAHFFKAPPITSFPYGDTIKLPESENDAKKNLSRCIKSICSKIIFQSLWPSIPVAKKF